ncbi:MAG TPA: SidA/IucD/PvdA family monooxygenase [Thermoanaerobaculia bacterium]|nr:SidA/IucD/PvdA family monooxygenase [Thermoanaerobaculia bacterium]
MNASKQRTRNNGAATRAAGAAFDVVGIGFGPANLSLALGLKEEPEALGAAPLDHVFLERKPTYEWHPDMLLSGAEVQVPFLKDLVTLRNPTSRFTFLNYLQLHGRLIDFVNLRSWFPTRLEFNHYYRWVAAQLADHVRYGREVLEVLPVGGQERAGGDGRNGGDGAVELLRIVARHLATGEVEEYLARHLVVATGAIPYIPPGIDIGVTDKVFHSQGFLSQVRRHFPREDAPYRFIVVGSGQSAAEIFQYLFSHYPNAEVTAVMRRFAFKPADESEFVNELYAPAMTDVFFGLPEAERRALHAVHSDTNYSAVDVELIRAIFKAMYERKVIGDAKVRIRSLRELRQLEPDGAAIAATLWNKAEGRLEHLEADGVVLATGFERTRRLPLLRELSPFLLGNGDGTYRVGRDYRVQSVTGFAPKVYLQGFCESTHGLPDGLLSVLPVRSGEIARSLLADAAAGAARNQDLVPVAAAAAFQETVSPGSD